MGKWKEPDVPGYLEIDLVSHSGEIAAGEWAWTLTATDISTGWTERVPIHGRRQAAVLAALERVREQLPFPLLGLHPDHGREFLNWRLVTYCQGDEARERAPVLLSRSRPEHMNDCARAERKNWTLVRKLLGWQRLDTQVQLQWLDQLCTELLRPCNNCFQPVMKPVGKQQRTDGHTRMLYDTPATALQRVLDSGRADPAKIGALLELYTTVSPLPLKHQIDRRLAAMPSLMGASASA